MSMDKNETLEKRNDFQEEKLCLYFHSNRNRECDEGKKYWKYNSKDSQHSSKNIPQREIILSIFFLLGILFFLNNVEAYQQNSCVQLTGICDSGCSVGMNLTSVSYPNSTYSVVGEFPMQKQGQIFNYTYCLTSALGTYQYCMHGDDNGIETQGCKSFDISPSGVQQSTAQALASSLYLFLILCLTLLFGFLGFKYSRNEYFWILGIFFLFLSLLFVVYDVWLGYEFHRNLSGINDGSAMPEIIFYIFLLVLSSGFLASLALLFTKWKKLKQWFKKTWDESKREQEEDEGDWKV